MLLEQLEYIDGEEGGATAIGSVLKDTPSHLMEPAVMAVELLKLEGCLSKEPFNCVDGKVFPQQLNYPNAGMATEDQKSKMVLTRLMSLVPMRLKVDMWNADVMFDLAAFHSMLRVVKRSLRQLTEACLASVLMQDLNQVKLLPSGFLCASPSGKDHLTTHALLPTFMLPRACMGIVAEYFLSYDKDPLKFRDECKQKFPCCLEPMEDLQMAIIFWEEMRRVMKGLVEAGLEVTLWEETIAADEMLKAQQKRLDFWPSKKLLRNEGDPSLETTAIH
jgi:hypothetical protein